MTDLHERFRAADRIPAPDLWPDILGRAPSGEPPSPRRPRSLTGVAVIVAAALLVLLLARLLPLTGTKPAGRTPTPNANPTLSVVPTPAPSLHAIPGLPSAVVPVGTTDLQSNVMSARYGLLFAISDQTQEGFTIVRVNRDGTTTSRRIDSPIAFSFGTLYAGPKGVYVGSQVIQRFSHAKDELLRLDPEGLEVTATVEMPGGVAGIVGLGDDLWVSAGNAVLRLDPVSLATRDVRAIADQPPPQGAESLSAPAVSNEGIWVLVGNDRKSLRLLRLDRRSLAVLSTASLAGSQDQEFFRVVGAPSPNRIRWVWLIGTRSIQRVNPLTGQLEDRPVAIGEIGGQAQPYGGGLLALIDADGGTIAVTDGRGNVVARTGRLGDVANLTVDEANQVDVWMAQGLRVLHVRLVGPPPDCLCG